MGLPRTERALGSASVTPAAHRTRFASSFRARAAYPAQASSPRLVALGEAAEVFREAAGKQFAGATLSEDVGWLASGDLFIAFPALDDFVPTSLWECLHNTGRHTIQLNLGFDMPQPPDCSCWRFRQAEFLLQARQLHQPEAERAAGDARTGR